MVNKSINALQPQLQIRVRNTLASLEKAGIKIAVIETDRTQEIQNAYYAQGRKPLSEVNALRQKAGLYLLSESENQRTVTNTLKSRHIGGNAVDLCPVKEGKLWWTAPQQVWEEIGSIAEKNGLDWCAGGSGLTWGSGWDNPHFELLKDF